MPFDPKFIARLIPALLEGAEVTVELALLTIAICLVWGLVVALAHAMRGPLGWLAGGYVQIVRNTPLLIQLYLVYFGFSMGGFERPAATHGENCSTLRRRYAKRGRHVSDGAVDGRWNGRRGW